MNLMNNLIKKNILCKYKAYLGMDNQLTIF